MNRSTRLFEIIQLLRSTRKSLTAQKLADELEVTKRTIYRDIVALQSMRVPIDGEAGVGYLLRPGFDLPPLMFTAEEVEAIAVGLSLLKRTGDASLENAAQSVARKISEVLPEENPYGLLSQSVFTSSWHNIPNSEVDPGTLRRAIRDETKLSIEYLDAEERTSSRVILPLALIYYVDSLVLATWCELRLAYRHFRVDRIQQCLATDQFFKESGQQLRLNWQAEHELR